VFLDIEATNENRKTICDIVRKTASEVFIPITVGGGVRSMEDITQLLNAGADKVSINSAAIKNPELITEASQKYGRQCIVIAVDAKRNIEKQNWEVHINGGRISTGIDVVQWCIKAEQMGAGEILLTSIDKDGMKTGYDIELTKAVNDSVNIPVIASGGAGKREDFLDVFSLTKCDAALAASLFHFGEIPIPDLKKYLFEKNIPIRI
jgi:cyclase